MHIEMYNSTLARPLPQVCKVQAINMINAIEIIKLPIYKRATKG